jgi:N-acetylglucosaminyldiphosphoundecaprenol N-acetyl-beta-D-mannosaminyltransferase
MALMTSQRYTAFALHVGGILHAGDSEFLRAFNAGDCRYGDGVASVLLARLAGAKQIERVPTTDLAPALFESFASGPQLRIALLGGPDGLARRAAEMLSHNYNVTVVYESHGFHVSWTAILEELRASRPQVLLVGMGMPIEAKWVMRNLDALPSCLVMTCGGWFGFVTGTERRAPSWMRRVGLEWIARLAQNPVRLAGRYAQGTFMTIALAMEITIRRARCNGTTSR